MVLLPATVAPVAGTRTLVVGSGLLLTVFTSLRKAASLLGFAVNVAFIASVTQDCPLGVRMNSNVIVLE